MAIKLYELDERQQEWYAKVEANDGEVTDELLEELEQLSADKDSKLEAYGVVYKNLLAELEAYNNEIKRLKASADSIKNNAERVLQRADYAMSLLKRDSFKSVKTTIGYRKSTATVVTDGSKVPDCFFKVERKPMLTEIKKAIEHGIAVEGAELVERRNIQIK